MHCKNSGMLILESPHSVQNTASLMWRRCELSATKTSMADFVLELIWKPMMQI